MALFNPLSFDEIVYKTFTYELDYFIPYYEEERSGGFNELDSDSCTDCVTIIPPQIDNPKVLISAPHATSQYRNYSYYSPYRYCFINHFHKILALQLLLMSNI